MNNKFSKKYNDVFRDVAQPLSLSVFCQMLVNSMVSLLPSVVKEKAGVLSYTVSNGNLEGMVEFKVNAISTKALCNTYRLLDDCENDCNLSELDFTRNMLNKLKKALLINNSPIVVMKVLCEQLFVYAQQMSPDNRCQWQGKSDDLFCLVDCYNEEYMLSEML